MIKKFARLSVLLTIPALLIATISTFSVQKASALPNRPIVYETSDGHVIVVNSDGTNRTDLGEGSAAKLSPDGTKIMFSAYSPQQYTIDVVVENIDGTNRVNLTNYPDVQDSPRSMQDGSWSPDGTKVTFSTGFARGSDVMVANVDGSSLTNLTNIGNQTPTPGVYHNLHPIWSPDGSRIAFNGCRPWPDGPNCGLYEMYADGSNQQRITPSVYIDREVVWSPDSQKIVYEGFDNFSPRFYIADANGGNAVLISSDPSLSSLKWSPDGNHIAWVSNGIINVTDADGSNQQTISGVTTSNVVWSPDSSALAYIEGGNVSAVPATGGTPTTVYADSAAQFVVDWAFTNYTPSTALTLHMPLSITAQATSKSGATVTYATPATTGGTPPVITTCSPISGSTFALGSTTVTCTAHDSLGTAATGNFKVNVQTTIANLKATNANNSQIGLSWQAPNAPAKKLDKYTIYDGNGVQVGQVAGTATTATITTLPGQDNFYYVVATDKQGDVVALSAPSNIPSPLLGDSIKKGNHTTKNPNGTAEAFSTKAATWGGSQNLTSLNFYLNKTSTASNAVMGIYADNAGQPGALIAQGSLANPTAGAWNTITLDNAVQLTSGRTYWFAILGTGTGTLAIRDGSTFYGNSVSYRSQETNLTTLPTTWTSGTSENLSPLAAYGGGYGVPQ